MGKDNGEDPFLTTSLPFTFYWWELVTWPCKVQGVMGNVVHGAQLLPSHDVILRKEECMFWWIVG